MQVPLTKLIPPALLPEPLESLIELVEVTDYDIDLRDGSTRIGITIHPAGGTDPQIPVGGPEGFVLVFKTLSKLDLKLDGDIEITFGLDELEVELPEILKRAKQENAKWVVDEANPRQSINLRSENGPLGLRWNSASPIFDS